MQAGFRYSMQVFSTFRERAPLWYRRQTRLVSWTGGSALYLDMLGECLEDRVLDHLAADYHGELLVGQATIVYTEHPDSFPLLTVAPTMRSAGDME